MPRTPEQPTDGKPSPDRISITICGDGGCGKSSITLRLVRPEVAPQVEYDPTIVDNYAVSRGVDGKETLLSLTDTAGQEEYRGLITSAAFTSDAFLLVYDITNPDSLDGQLPFFLDMVEQEREIRAEGINRPGSNEFSNVQPVVIVVGNKCDLKDERQITARTGLEWARQRGCGFMETSAKECVNIAETFDWIVRRVRDSREAYEIQKNGGPAPGVDGRSKPVSTDLTGNLGADGKAPDFSTSHLGASDEKGWSGRADGTGVKVPWWKRLKCW